MLHIYHLKNKKASTCLRKRRAKSGYYEEMKSKYAENGKKARALRYAANSKQISEKYQANPAANY